MPDEDIKLELDALRAELAKLSRRLDPTAVSSGEKRTAGADAAAVAASGDEDPSGEADRRGLGSKLHEVMASELGGHADAREISKHVATFLEALGRDVKDSKPKALIAAFIAGVAAGRMIGR